MAVEAAVIAKLISDAMQCVSDVTRVVNENQTAREQINLEGRRIDTDLKVKMVERDNELKLAFAEHKASLEQLREQCAVRNNELATERNKNGKDHTAQMENIRVMSKNSDRAHEKDMEMIRSSHAKYMGKLHSDHEIRMKVLTIAHEMVKNVNHYDEYGFQYGTEQDTANAQAKLRGAMSLLDNVTQSLLLLPLGD